MRTLVYDTETTGLAKFGQPLSEQPYIVQLAAILFDDERPVAHLSAITIPEFRGERAEIPERAYEVHKIDDELINKVGVPYRVALATFNNLLRVADRQVAHNTQFDHILVRAAYSRIAADQDLLMKVPAFCTMKTLTPVLKIPGRNGGYKWPTLMEAHEALLGVKFEGAHDAMVDVMACARVMFETERRGIALIL